MSGLSEKATSPQPILPISEELIVAHLAMWVRRGSDPWTAQLMAQLLRDGVLQPSITVLSRQDPSPSEAGTTAGTEISPTSPPSTSAPD